MGFFFRKSVAFGPIRLNFSKSGIGVSAGVKGARVSTGPRGTYVHAGANGFYYSQRIRTSPVENRRPTSDASRARIETADVSQLNETSIAALLSQINERAARPAFAPIAIGATIIGAILAWILVASLSLPLAELVATESTSQLSMFFGFAAGVLVGTGGGALSWLVHKGDQTERTTPLFYELDANATTKFLATSNACRTLSQSSRIWRVHSNQPTSDWKRNAGANTLISRQVVSVGVRRIPFIATNIDVWAIDLQALTLFFLPDYVFVRQGNRYGAVSYESLKVSCSSTIFIENLGVPGDAQVVDYTWRFVNKKGGPDRRFSSNHQIPIVEYGLLQLESDTGLNIHLHVSSLQFAETFAKGFKRVGPTRSQYSDSRQKREPRTAQSGKRSSSNSSSYSSKQPTYIDPKIKLAYETLGVSIDSTSEEVVSAYRCMAKMYHPDKLLNMAPEFVELAEERMKEINAAYEVLKRR